MSSMQIQLFNSSILRLAQSLIIKDEYMASNVNEPIAHEYLARGLDVNDLPLTEHKYYMNAAGMYHFTDTPMQVISLDTMETIDFTIESLELHRGTRRQYRTKGRYYQELVNAYPNQEALIKGILNPVDLNYAISAPNYTILQYDVAEVEPQETNLISKLQEMIYTYMDRWIVKDYEKVDKYYPEAQLCVLYMMLPKMIDNIRLDNCKTYKAHMFHVWNYLDSHGELGEYRDYLLTSQAMWLYMNINWVYANVGKQETFEKLVEVILTRRGIPVGQYETVLDTTEVGEALKAEVFMKRTPINLLDRVGDSTVDKSVEYVMEKQIPLARDNILAHEEDMEALTEELSIDLINRRPTKVYESEMIDLSERLYITLEEILLENWMYMGSKELYIALINVQNPNTSDVMTLSVRDAFSMWLYVTNKLMGFTLTEIPTMVAHNVPAIKRPTFEQMRKITSPRYVWDSQLTHLINSTPIPGQIISTAAFYEFTTELHETLLSHRKYYSVCEHKDTRGQLEGVVQKLFPSIPCKLVDTPTTYSKYFKANGWDIETLNHADLEILSEELFLIGTGLNLNDVTSIADIQKAMLSLMSRLGEYSSHYIQTINTSPATIADFVNLRVGDTWQAIHRVTRQTTGVHVQESHAEIFRTEKIKVTNKLDLSHRTYLKHKKTDADFSVDYRPHTAKAAPARINMSGIHYR